MTLPAKEPSLPVRALSITKCLPHARSLSQNCATAGILPAATTPSSRGRPSAAGIRRERVEAPVGAGPTTWTPVVGWADETSGHNRRCGVSLGRSSRRQPLTTGCPSGETFYVKAFLQCVIWHRSVALEQVRFLSFLLAERKERTLGKERKEPLLPLPPASREGRAELHCETRSPLPGPSPLTRARLGLLAARR